MAWISPHNHCSSLPFSCRKTMVVHWSARNMSVKSSSAWASKGQNVPRRSLHYLSTSPSTPSGYTKCSNFTPVWRGTKTLQRENQIHSGPCRSLREERRECGPENFRDLSVTSPVQDHRGEIWKITLWKVAFLGFCGWIWHFVEGTETSGWRLDIIKTGSHPLVRFADEDLQVVSLNTIFTTKVPGTWMAN